MDSAVSIQYDDGVNWLPISTSASKIDSSEEMRQQAHVLVDQISHEFRTPLTVIKEFSALIREGVVGQVTEEQQRMLTVVESRVDDLNTLVSDVLDLRKMDLGILGAWRTPNSLADVLGSVLEPLLRRASAKEISIDLQIADDLPEVYCDSEVVARAVTNLAASAIRLCEAPGSILIAAAHAGGDRDVTVEVTLSDSAEEDDEQVDGEFEKTPEIGVRIARQLVDLSLGSFSHQGPAGMSRSFRLAIPVNEPDYIVECYLRRIAKCTEASPPVTFLLLAIDDAALADQVDSLLSYLVQSKDLLVRLAGGNWLVARPVGREQMSEYGAQLNAVRQRVNLSRPQAPLPHVAIETLGSWQPPFDARIVADAVREELCLV